MTREEAIKEYIMPALKRTWRDDTCIEIISAIEQDPYEVVLNKIRAEIEETTSRYNISRERGAMGQVEWSDRLIKESEVLEIIDKYKVESEG